MNEEFRPFCVLSVPVSEQELLPLLLTAREKGISVEEVLIHAVRKIGQWYEETSAKKGEKRRKGSMTIRFSSKNGFVSMHLLPPFSRDRVEEMKACLYAGSDTAPSYDPDTYSWMVPLGSFPKVKDSLLRSGFFLQEEK